MALVTYQIHFNPTPGSYGVLIEYRVKNTSTWITPTALPNPTLISPYTLTLDNTQEYDIRVSSDGGPNCTRKYRYVEITNDTPTFIWIAGDTECEKEGGFSVIKTITGLSSPNSVWYDTITGRVYVADIDSPAGNVYWFNPNTANTEADVTHSATFQFNELYNTYIDTLYRRMYFVGASNNGLTVYNIDSDSVSTVAFGSNGAFQRTALFVTSDRIYCNAGSVSIVIIDRATLNIISTIPIGTIPNPTHFSTGPFIMVEANSNIYVVSNNASIGTVGVYNPSLTSSIAEITLPGAATWSFGRYWQSIFYDTVGGVLYVGDTGSSSRHIINPATNTVVDSKIARNKENKLNAAHSWTINPNNNQLLAAYIGANSSADTLTIKRMYLEDRSTNNYTNMFKDQYFPKLVAIDGQNKVMGNDTGAPYWSGSPSYSTDGTITILSNSASGDNTGINNVVNLDEINEETEVATGNTKPNVPSDDDYIPPFEDLSNCPVTYSTVCPTDFIATGLNDSIIFEFSLPSAVITNPAIAFIKVKAMLSGLEQGSKIFTLPNSTDNYFSDTIISLANATTYNLDVEYLSSGSIVVASCPNLTIVTTT